MAAALLQNLTVGLFYVYFYVCLLKIVRKSMF